MQSRRLGRTDHWSSIAIMGGYTLADSSEQETNRIMEQVVSAGVNHIDIAPTYGNAETNLGNWLAKHDQRFFISCKTTERDEAGASAELHRSLERLHLESFDLYQLHAVNTWEELDLITQSGGALEALLQAREEGLLRFIGITGHGADSPLIDLEALQRFNFDTILIPVNFILYSDREYQLAAKQLLEFCAAADVGVMAIKAVARQPWGQRRPTHTTWYEPFTDPGQIQLAVNFALSQEIAGICTVGDPQVLPLVLEACKRFNTLSPEDQAALIATAGEYETIF